MTRRAASESFIAIGWSSRGVRGLAAARGGEPEPLAPGGVVVEGGEVLDGLGPPRAGLEQGLERLAELGEAPVGGLAVGVVARGPVQAVEGGGDLENLAPELEEVAVDHGGGVAGGQH